MGYDRLPEDQHTLETNALLRGIIFSLLIFSSGPSYSLLFHSNLISLCSFQFISALLSSQTEEKEIEAAVYNDTQKSSITGKFTFER